VQVLDLPAGRRPLQLEVAAGGQLVAQRNVALCAPTGDEPLSEQGQPPPLLVNQFVGGFTSADGGGLY